MKNSDQSIVGMKASNWSVHWLDLWLVNSLGIKNSNWSIPTKCVEERPLQPVWRPTVTVVVTLHCHVVNNNSIFSLFPSSSLVENQSVNSVTSQSAQSQWLHWGPTQGSLRLARSLPHWTGLVSPLVSLSTNHIYVQITYSKQMRMRGSGPEFDKKESDKKWTCPEGCHLRIPPYLRSFGKLKSVPLASNNSQLDFSVTPVPIALGF